MPDADPASTLAAIREDNDRVIALCAIAPAAVRQLADHDVPALLAAVEATLKLADEWRAAGCPESAEEEALMWREIECGDRLRAAITAALGGKEAGGGT